jgi:hemerythrin-like metal-binding protein
MGLEPVADRFELTSEFQVGNREIDTDHQRLVDEIGSLRAVLSDGVRSARVYGGRFAAFIEMVREHFQREKSLLFECGFPAAREHADFHGLLLAELKEMQAEFAKEVLSLDAERFYHRMLALLVHDFVRKDLEFKSFLQETA